MVSDVSWRKAEEKGKEETFFPLIPDGCRLYFLGLIKVTNWLFATNIANTKSWEKKENFNLRNRGMI